MGTYSQSTITISHLPSQQPIRTTVHEYVGDSDGPTVYVQAAQHGYEVNGTEVLRRLHDELRERVEAGRVVAVPIASPLTFDHSSYTTPRAIEETHPNMNRVWPGDSDGTVHERIAARLWEYAGEADVIIDLHTMSPDALSHVVVTEDDDEGLALARAFGTDLALVESRPDEAGHEWHRRNFSGKLRVAATRRDITCITPELGYNTWIDEPAVETGIRGVQNVLREVGILAGDPASNGTPRLARNHLGRVTATDSGLFVIDPDVEIGDTVEAGDALGTVYDPSTYEVHQEVRADRDGTLYALTREATIIAGETLANVALPLER
ncbi:succinylglutamate desuccinylase/aspartoacylase family protein [Halorubrum sp. DTA98]|uniref:succinylglutamate desuccinylase/aspartoacylase family protein n=1 Tax=Halorubrum sp. DTA98 TaxID=3402163 RepID=UPI003AACACCF